MSSLTAVDDTPLARFRHGLRVARRRIARGIRELLDDRWTTAAVVVLLMIVLGAVFAPWLSPASPTELSVPDRLKPPAMLGGSWEHPLGTDGLGRDMLTRLLYGARVSLIIGATVSVLAGTFGVVMGMVAGYLGGRVDSVIMRIVDAQLAFPGLLLILTILTMVGPSVPVIVLVLSLYGWMVYARLVRSLVLELRGRLYVEASRVVGARTPRIIRRHLLPGLWAPVLTQAMLEFARAVLAEAALSYLGLGVQPPDASWGLMVAENQTYVALGWWTITLPGVAIALTVLSINTTAGWLRVQSDPEQRRSQGLMSVREATALERGADE